MSNERGQRRMKRSTRRGAMAGGGAVAAGVLGVACGGAATSPPEAKRTQPVTLEAWSRLSWFKGLADAYNAGPGAAELVTLNPTLIGNPLDFQNKMITAAASATTPDFTTVELNITPGLNVQGIYADVSKDYARLKQKDQFPAALVRYGNQEGKVLQIPFWVDASGLFFNRNLLKGAGLPETGPKTWEEMTQLAVRLTRAPDTWGVTIPYNGSATWMFMPWVYANGGRLLSDDGKQSLVNSEEAAGAFTLWNDLAQKRQVTPDGFRTRATFNANDLFLQCKLAMYHSSVSFLNTLKKDAPDLIFGTATLPVGPRGKRTGCSPGGDTMGLLPSNKYRAETWRLMEWLISDEAQVEYIVQGRYGIPILSGQFENKYFKDEPRFLPFREAAQAATPTWTTRFEEIKAVMLPEYMAAVQGDKEPRAAQREMHEAIQRELAKV
jgi:multiple sugar transport system substrate-binding protein